MLLALQSSCVAGSHSCPFRAVHDTCSARQFLSTFKLDVLTQPQTETATVEAMQKQLGDLEASHAQMSLVQSRLLSLALGAASPFTSLSRARALSRSLSPSPSLVLSLSLSLARSLSRSLALFLSLQACTYSSITHTRTDNTRQHAQTQGQLHAILQLLGHSPGAMCVRVCAFACVHELAAA